MSTSISRLHTGTALGLVIAAGIVSTTVVVNPKDATSYMYAQAWNKPQTNFYNFEPQQSSIKTEFYTAKEIIIWLRGEGLPIAAIADISLVERKTVYAWLNGGPAKEQNLARLTRIYRLLLNDKQADLRSLYRMWNRKFEEGKSLGELLSENDINNNAITHLLNILWPAAKKYMNSNLTQADFDVRENPVLVNLPKSFSSDDV